MSYRNYNRNYNGGQNWGVQNGGQYRQNYDNWNGGNNNNRPKKKRSGASAGMDKNGNPYVRGWNASKTHGLRSFLAVPYKGTGKHKSGSGKVWHNWMVKVQPKGGQPYIVSGLYDEATRRVIVKDLQFVINPSKNYCGTYVRHK